MVVSERVGVYDLHASTPTVKVGAHQATAPTLVPRQPHTRLPLFQYIRIPRSQAGATAAVVGIEDAVPVPRMLAQLGAHRQRVLAAIDSMTHLGKQRCVELQTPT